MAIKTTTRMKSPDQAETHDDPRQRQTVPFLRTAGVLDLTAGDEAEDDAENAREAEEERDDAGACADQGSDCQTIGRAVQARRG